MNKTQMLSTLSQLDKTGNCVFDKSDFEKLFPDEPKKTLSESLNRAVQSDLMQRACYGTYVNHHAKSFNSFIIEHIAKKLRKGHYNYISLESTLSEHGAISQIPIDRLTVVTTGRSGTYKTKYGVIEFIHTKRTAKNILEHTYKTPEHVLRIALEKTAIRDLKRVGRNTHLLN